jgi:serine/threonine-protein kinase
MIREASAFYGRRREVAKIFARIGASRPQSVAIVGDRRIGKSSLLRYLYHPEVRRHYLDDPGAYTFVHLDLQEQRDIGLPAFFETLFHGIEAALGRAWPQGLPANYEGARRALLALQEEQHKIILLFDEFDAITNNQNFPEEFFAFLRAVANKYDVAYVTTSGRDLQQLCHTDRIADSPFFNIFSNLFLTRFEPDEALALVTEPSAAAGVPLASQAAAILDLSGLFPFFIQIACSAFFEQLTDGGALDLARAQAAFIEEAEPHFKYICDHLDEDQHRVLADVIAGRVVPASHSYVLNKLKRDGYVLEQDGAARLFSSVFAACLPGSRSNTSDTGATGRAEGSALEGASGPTISRVGRQLGSWQFVSPLGAGGMGEVYRARDVVLGREVAIKVLPGGLRLDGDRRARLEREARALAALNHPNICTIHGLVEAEGLLMLVLELVEGVTLADRLAVGPMEVGDVLVLGRQLAEALEAAHAKGIVHRDLKPANVKLTPTGTVKVLDFGLAKMRAADVDIDLSQALTFSATSTGEGVILGTAAYMSPEQARGLPLDERTDIWSYGCVLFETLTGRVAFRGSTLSDTIARILELEPDWRLLPASVPTALQELLGRCIQKDRQHRLASIAGARAVLEDIERTGRGLRRPLGGIWSSVARALGRR